MGFGGVFQSSVHSPQTVTSHTVTVVWLFVIPATDSNQPRHPLRACSPSTEVNIWITSSILRHHRPPPPLPLLSFCLPTWPPYYGGSSQAMFWSFSVANDLFTGIITTIVIVVIDSTKRDPRQTRLDVDHGRCHHTPSAFGKNSGCQGRLLCHWLPDNFIVVRAIWTTIRPWDAAVCWGLLELPDITGEPIFDLIPAISIAISMHA